MASFNTAQKLPTSASTANSGIEWANPTYITADDANNAVVATAQGEQSRWLVGKSFGFNIPTGATITGIEVVRNALQTTFENLSIGITKDGTTNAGNAKVGTHSTSLSNVTYGGSSDLWGGSFTPAEINSANFGVFNIAYRSQTGSGQVQINYLHVKIYFTYNDVRYWVGGSATWDSTAGSKWALVSGGESGYPVPASTSDVFLDANSGASAVALASGSCKDITLTGFTGSLTSADLNIYGNFVGSATASFSNGAVLTFKGAGSKTIATNGMSMAGTYFQGGTLTLSDNFTQLATTLNPYFDLQGSVIVNTNAKTVTVKNITTSGTTARTLNITNSIINLTATSGNSFSYTGSNLNFVKTGATIKVANAGTTFAGGNLAFNNVELNGTGITTISGSNTFADLKFVGGSTIKFTAGTTQTVTTFTTTATPLNQATIESTSAGSAFTLSKPSGTLEINYISIKDSTATGGATWSALYSTSVSGNTGWLFTPTFSTTLTSKVYAYSATANALVSHTGTGSILKRGFIYSTSSMTKPENVAPETTGHDYVVETGTFSTGAFSSIIETTPNTGYYVRAFVQNPTGYFYGGQLQFTTRETGIEVNINNVERQDDIVPMSFRVKDNINQQIDECNFEILGQKPQLGDEVTVHYNGEKIYGGVIIKTQTNKQGLYVTYSVTCKDYSQYLNRKLVNKTYKNKTVTEIIIDILDTYTEGFTHVNVSCDIMVKQISFNRTTVTEALEDLAEAVKYNWYIDYDKDIHFFESNTELSPFNLTDTSKNFLWDSLSITDDFSQIRNKVIIIGGEYEADTRSESYIADGTQKQFPLAYKFSSLPTVTVNGVAKTVGVDGLDTVNGEDSHDCFWSYNEKYIRFKDTTFPVASATVVTSGTPLLPVIVNVPDLASINEYGTYEFKIEDRKINSRDDAIARGLTELQAYAGSISAGSFSTYNSGLRSGQLINITVGDVSENFIIQSVSMSMRGHDAPLYNVTIGTTKTQGIINILQKLLRKDEIAVEGTVLLELLNYSDSAEISDALTLPSATHTGSYRYGTATIPADEGRWNFSTYT